VTEGDRLVGFVNVISDGIGDAFLVDLMVHPEHQHQGLATALVTRAIEEVTADGIRCIQVIFDSTLDAFYRRFGFEIVNAGIVDRWSPKAPSI
jgi:ribosomal protein S18 acetylase RimI-like enzyme